MIGSTIGPYRITALLGEGGMGMVYRATDNIEREVAIKALHPHLTRDESGSQRFRTEAIALGRLHHPNIAGLFHLLEQDNNFYMVMEFVEGQTLEDLIRLHGALPPRLALDIFIDGLHGFEHAHARGVIHRDIKPSNLMVSSEGTTKITDLGIARLSGAERLTQTGKLLGTLEYMSPEQVQGVQQDTRSDIYSLGILLFELLTGRVPFTDASDFELMRAHLEKAPVPARHFVPSLPQKLDEIIAIALAKDPNERFDNVAQMREALEAVAVELPEIYEASTIASTQTHAATNHTPKGKYATVLIGTSPPPDIQPTPVPQNPVAPASPAAPIAPAPVASTVVSPVASTARGWNFSAIMGIGSLAILVVVALAWGVRRSTSNTENTYQRAPISRQSPTKRVTTGESKTTISKQPAPQRKPRKAASTVARRKFSERVRVKPKTRLATRKVVRRRPIAISKRPQPSRSTINSDRAALRAIVKGN